MESDVYLIHVQITTLLATLCHTYEEVCAYSMFIAHFDTISHIVAIEEIAHFAYIFLCRLRTIGHKKNGTNQNNVQLYYIQMIAKVLNPVPF